MSSFHTPVLLQSACTFLAIHPGEKYVDATIGGGGHTEGILAQGGLVLGIDQDQDAISSCQTSPSLQPALASGQLLLDHSNFIYLPDVVTKYSWVPLMGIIFDLGVSSHQINTPGRGFSFQSTGPLDMRMDVTLPHTAATIVNTFPLSQIAGILKDYGEIGPSLAVAQKIITSRPYVTTDQLKKVLGHPQLTRQVFQAIRIAVNDELGALSASLSSSLSLLAKSGRIVVITFHSLEDRIVKNHFQTWEYQHMGQILTPHPIRPIDSEILNNPRSKSAKLRCFIKNI